MKRLPIILTVLWSLVSLFTACEEEKRYYVANVTDGDNTPTMSTVNVHTFISDSGYTKYYIKTDLWNMYDEAAEPFWNFPAGVQLEQYDDRQNIEATLRCDSAKYLSQRRMWQLDGNVVMVNVRRDTFLTNQVFWDQAKRKIYSDSFVHIVKTDRIIEGFGFESNEQMTAYDVRRPTGIFPVKKSNGSASPPSAAPDAEASPAEGVRRAPAPRRASERADEQGLIMLDLNK